MEVNDHTYEKIQRYLDKEMKPDELRDFEENLKTDSVLQKEVSLNDEMQRMLADTPENALRKNLQTLNDRVRKDPNASSNRKPFWLLLLPILLLGAWFFFNSQPTVEDATTTEEVVPDVENQTVAPELKEQNQETEQPTNAIPEKTTEKEVRQPSEPKSEKPAKPKRAIAANYEPNDAIEFLIENNLRDNGFELIVEKTPQDIELKNSNSATPIQFAASIKSEQSLKEQNFALHIFTNDKTAFQDFEPLFSFDLTLNKIEENSYKVSLQKELQLAPRLYYYIMEETGKEKIYHVGKFVINGF